MEELKASSDLVDLLELYEWAGVPEKFDKRLNKTSTCWLWTGSVVKAGYSYVTYYRQRFLVHRLAYMLANGPLHPGVYVDHKCHVKHCANPAHLRSVTPKQNAENKGILALNNSSGYRGVSQRKSDGTWRAIVRHHGKHHEVSGLPTAEAANVAAIALRRTLFTHSEDN